MSVLNPADIELLVAGGQVVAVDAARARRYQQPRALVGVGRHVPIHTVTPQSALRPFGTLHPLAGGGFWMDEADKAHGRSAFHDSLPWFLYDMRP